MWQGGGALDQPAVLFVVPLELSQEAFGLDGHEPLTLDEVGQTFNVTRERIRQIEQQTLKNLRVLATPELLDQAL